MPDFLLLTSTETVALIRDIFLIAFLVLGFVTLIVGLMFAVSLYRRINTVVDKAEETIERIDSAADFVEGVVGTARGVSGVLSFGGMAQKLFGRLRRS